MSWTLHEFDSRAQLNQALADAVSASLGSALAARGKAVLAVSGGRTPAELFRCLSRARLAWSNITVTLVDDRCVPADSPDSNARLVTSELLQNQAAHAQFVPLYPGKSQDPDITALEARFRSLQLVPLDTAILGMGNDGHTASLFPCAPNIDVLMQERSPHLFYAVDPVTAPWKRITFSLPVLLQSGNLMLQLAGDDKRAVLEQALAGTSTTEMPIRAFLHHPQKRIDIYWAP